MFSKIVRRTHMYLALALMPWVLMYAISTMVMNHREFFLEKYGGQMVRFEKEREAPYEKAFPSGATPQQMAAQIVKDFDLDGTHNVRKGPNGTFIILRQDALAQKRLTYDPAARKVSVDKEIFRSQPFLERMHRRRGFQSPYAVDDFWAATVDIFIAGMIFWVLSGLWMWWEMKVTRAWGAVFGLAGVALFAFFLSAL
ncbi:MAG: hypothetical protein ACRD44_07995 [Bryobacteraceae bacterium]